MSWARQLLLTGALGSALIALGGAGVGALPPGNPVGSALGVEALRGSAFALAMCVVGLVLLAGAWWCSRDLSHRHLLAACGLWSLPMLVAPPLLSRDLYAYAGQGALVAEGLDPYSIGPGALSGPLVDGVDDVWLDTPSPYGPLFLGLAGLVVRVTGESPVAAVLALRLLAVLGVLLLVWALPRLARAHGVPPGRALWLGVANPLLLLHLVGGGHNDALMMGLLAAGLAVAWTVRVPWRLVLAAVLVTLAVLVKVPALVGLAYLPLTVPGGWRTRARAAAVVAATAGITAGAVSWLSGLGWGWLGTLTGGRERLSLFSPLTGLGVALPGGDRTLDVVLALGLLTAALLCGVLLLRAPRVGLLRSLGLSLLLVSVLLPVVQPWYVLWGVVLLAAVARPRQATALGAVCLVLCLTVAPSGRSVVRPPLYGLPTLLAAAAGVLVLRGRASAADVEEGIRPRTGQTATQEPV